MEFVFFLFFFCFCFSTSHTALEKENSADNRFTLILLHLASLYIRNQSTCVAFTSSVSSRPSPSLSVTHALVPFIRKRSHPSLLAGTFVGGSDTLHFSLQEPTRYR